MELRMIQLQMAKFEYEVREKSLNLYDRIDRENGESTLRFLAQVPFEGDLETSVKSAVGEIYGNLNIPEKMRVQAKDLRSRRKEIHYFLYG